MRAPGENVSCRSIEVDLLRILSASLIFYFHVGFMTELPAYGIAQFATGVFIVAAGYCSLRYSRTGRALQNPSPGAGFQFVKSRFLSLYPTYAIVTVLIFVGSYLYPASDHDTPFSFRELIVNLLGVNRLFGVTFFTEPMWFFPFLMQVYLLIPVLCLLRKSPRAMILIAFFVSTAASLLVYFLVPTEAVEICRSWSPIFRLPIVAAGIVLALEDRWTETAKSLLVFVLCALIREALATWLPEFGYTLGLPLRNFLMFSALTAVAVGGAWVIRRLEIPSAWITSLAQASFPFFLLHGIFMHLIDARTASTPLIWAVYYVMCWVASLAYLQVYSAVRLWLKNRKEIDVAAVIGE